MEPPSVQDLPKRSPSSPSRSSQPAVGLPPASVAWDRDISKVGKGAMHTPGLADAYDYDLDPDNLGRPPPDTAG